MTFPRALIWLIISSAALATSCQPGPVGESALSAPQDVASPAASRAPRRAEKEPRPAEKPSDRKDFPLPQGWPRPVIKAASARTDARVGLNLHLDVMDFDFAPETLGHKELDASRARAYGFVHLYINGRKKNRIYGADFYLKEDELDPGWNDLRMVFGTPGYGVWLGAEPFDLKVEKPARPEGARPQRKPRR